MAFRRLLRSWFSSSRRPIEIGRPKVRLLLERLEDRLAPATVSDGGTSTLTLALAPNENLSIVSNGATYTITSNLNFTNGGVANTGDFSAFGTTSLTLQLTGIARYTTAISITDSTGASANDTVTFNNSGGNYANNITIALTNAAAGSITFNGATSFAGSSTLTAKGGAIDFNAGSVSSAGTISLTATNGGILETAAGAGADVNAATVTLATTGASQNIGTPPPVGGTGTPIKVNATTLLNASTNNGFITLANTTGNLPLGVLNAGAAMIDLTAVNAITDGNNGGGGLNLTAASGAALTTTGSNSAIGTSALPIRTAIGFLTATTNDGGVFIADSNGPGLIINSIQAQQGGSPAVLNGSNHVVYFDSSHNEHVGTYNVSVTATGPILLATVQGVSTTVAAPNAVTINSTGGNIAQGTPGTDNVLARSVNLTAGGSVGITGGAIGLTVENFSASTTNGSIFLNELIPGTAVSVVAGGAGNSVSVTGSGTTLGIDTITAPGTVTLQESGGALVSSPGMNVSGQTVSLTGKAGIGSTGSPFTVTASNLLATASTAGAGIFVSDTTALSTVSATTNAGDTTITYTGGSLHFTASTGLLTAAGPATVSFDNTGGNVELGAVQVASITASGAIIAGPGVNLTGGTVTLTAGTGIGAPGSPINTNVTTLNATTTSGDIVVVQTANPLTVNATSQGYTDPPTKTGSDISVTTNAGALTVGSVLALGTVTLNSSGAILPGAILPGAGNAFNVSASTLSLTATNGIGTSASALTSAVSTLTAAGGVGGGIFLSNSKTLTLTSASATGGAVSITTIGDLNVGSVSAAGQAVTLSATGALIDPSGPALNVTAHSATLSGASIGSASDFLETQVSSITATAAVGGIYIHDLGTGTITVTATAAGQGSNIDFTSDGSISLMTVTAKGNTVTLNAAGSITNGLTAAGINITAQTLSIAAPGGIGTSANPLEILVAQIALADGGVPGVFMNNAGPVQITASALEAAGSGTLTFTASSITILDLGSTPVSLAPGRSLFLKTDTGPIVFLNQANTIQTSGAGTITVEAGTTPGSGGVAVLGNLTTAGGNIKVTADYNITIGLLNAGAGNVTVQSANGIILDGNGPSTVNIIAGTTTLSGNGPTARQLELDEEIKIAAAAAATAEAAADQTTSDAFNSQLPIINSQVDALTQTTASDLAAALALDQQYLDATNVLNGLNLAVAALQTADLAVDFGVIIALDVAGPAQAVPIFGDGGANTIYAVLQTVEDGIRVAIEAAQVAADAYAFKVTKIGIDDVAADILAGTDQATLTAEQLTQQTAKAAAAIAQAAAGNALLQSETAQVVSNQAIAARDQANVIGSKSDPIGIQVTGVVNVTAGPTDSFLEVTGNTAVDQINATGSVTLISTGAITNGAPAGTPNILATGLTISAVNGIGTAANPLLTRVGTLNATNTGTGDIDISNTAGTPAALAITGISNSSGGNVVIANKGNDAAGEGITVTGPIGMTGAGTDSLTLNSGSPLTISANMISPGPIALNAAADVPPVGDNLTVLSGVTVQSTGSSVSLSAGNNIDVQAGSTIEAATTISITGGAVSANVVVEGMLIAPSASIGVDPATNNKNTFTITPSASTPITVTGGTAAGTNVLNFNADGLPVTIMGNTITAAGDKPVTFSDFSAVNLLNPAGGGSVTLNALPGANDNLVLTGTGPGAGTFTLNGGTPISFNGVTTFTYNGGNQTEAISVTPFATPLQQWGVAVTINGGTGPATLTYNELAGLSENLTIQPSATGAGQVIDTNAATGASVAVVTYFHTNNIVVSDTSTGAAGDTDNLFVDGTQSADTIDVNDAASGANAVKVGALVTVTYPASMPHVEVDALAGSDAINVVPSATTSFLVNGGDPIGVQPGDTLNLIHPAGLLYVNYAGPTSDSGGLKTQTLQTVSWVQIETVTNSTAGGPGGPAKIEATNGNDIITVIATGNQSFTVSINNGQTNAYTATPDLFIDALAGNDVVDVKIPASVTNWDVQVFVAGSGPESGAQGLGDIIELDAPDNASAAGVTYTPNFNVTGLPGVTNVTFTQPSTGGGQFNDPGETSTITATGFIYGTNTNPPLETSPSAGVENFLYAGEAGNGTLTYNTPANANAGSDVVYTPGANSDAGAITGNLIGGAGLTPLTFSGLGGTGTVQFTTANTGRTDHLNVEDVTSSVGDQFTVTPANGGTITIARPGPNGAPVTDTLLAPSVNTLELDGLGGSDVFSLSGTGGGLPFTNGVVVNDGTTVNLTGAVGPVTVFEGDNTPNSANPNTVITGYGAPVTLIGVDTANLDASGNTVTDTPTTQNDNTIYTPTGTTAGTFYDDIGSGNNLVPNTVFNITNVSGNFMVFNDPGGNADQVTIRGTAARDLFEINQGSGVAQVLANNTTALLPVELGISAEILNAEGLGGQNTFQVIPAPGIGGQAQDNLLINLDGGTTGAFNALVVGSSFGSSPGQLAANQFVVVNKNPTPGNGTVRVFTAAVANPDINYKNIQTVSPIVAGTSVNPNLLVIGADMNEPNEQQGNAAFLGAGATLNVQNATIFASNSEFPGNPADQDYYRVVAQTTGTLDFQVYFRTFNPALLPGGGQLDLQALDVNGNVIASAPGLFGADPGTGNARIRIPDVAGQSYFLRVFGATASVVNGYNVTVVNTAPPTPFNLELSRSVAAGVAGSPDTGDLPPGAASSDSGRSQFDNVTKVNTPTIFLRLSDGVLLNDLPGNGAPNNPPAGVIPIPFSPNANTAGFRVAIFDGNNTQTPVGFATPVGAGFPGLYTYTLTTALADGIHHLTAAVQMVDPANPTETGFGPVSTSLDLTIDTVPPPATFGTTDNLNNGLDAASDSGVTIDPPALADRITNVTAPTFYGTAEANAITRVYAKITNPNNANFGLAFPAGYVLIGQTVATPIDGTNALPGGRWSVQSNVSLDDPRFFVNPNAPAAAADTTDGTRTIAVTGEDLAGNVSLPQTMLVFVDTSGPQVGLAPGVAGNPIQVGGFPLFNLFALKPQNFTQGPTPLVNSLVINIVDNPYRDAGNFANAVALDVGPNTETMIGVPLSTAVNGPVGALDPGLYSVSGDQTGNADITNVTVVNNPVVTGQPATATITLTFSSALPDDRFTLTIKDSVIDPASNKFDGESNAADPGAPVFPSGNGVPGGNFAARFTVDSRPHVGVTSEGTQMLDINGNGVWDLVNAVDATNDDHAFNFGFYTENVFSGDFAPAGKDALGAGMGGTNFQTLGTYGKIGGAFRWTLSFYGVDGAAPGAKSVYSVVSGAQINGLPIAGHFNPAINASEIGLFDGYGNWYIDFNHTNNIGVGSTVLHTDMRGFPMVGDFDGDGNIDLATFRPDTNTWEFDLGALTANPTFQSFSWGFPSVQERPIAADMNSDGVTDIGLFVPTSLSSTTNPGANWYFLEGPKGPAGTVAAFQNPAFPFDPSPFSSDAQYSFGPGFDLPLVGIWDPPALANTPVFSPAPGTFTNGSVSAAVTTIPDGGSAGVMARAGANGQSGIFGGVASSNGVFTAQIVQYVNGNATTLASTPLASFTPGSTVQLQVVGTTAQLAINGTTLLSAVNSAAPAGTAAGTAATPGSEVWPAQTASIVQPTITLPFSDALNQADGALLGASWDEWTGSFRTQATGAVAQAPVDVATVHAVSLADINASVNIVSVPGGGFAGLVDRYDPATGNRYRAGIAATTNSRTHVTTYTAQIWLDLGGKSKLLASTPITSGSGTLNLVTAGSALQLDFNGIMILATNNAALATGKTGMYATQGATLTGFTATPVGYTSAGLPYATAFGSATPGTDWSAFAGGFSTIGGSLVGVGSVNALTLNGVSVANVTVQAQINALPPGTSAGVLARTNTATGDTYWAGLVSSYDPVHKTTVYTAQIRRTYHGITTVLWSSKVHAGPGLLQLTVNGGTLSLSVNGMPLGTAHDALLTQAGTVGIQGGQGSRFGGFSAA